MYYALIIPVVVTLIAYRYWPHKITYWELCIPILTSVVCIFASFIIMKETTLHDVEYNGDLVVEARYYEYWETYVEQTCTRSYDCGTKDNPQTCTETYDCSYCDKNRERYEVVLLGGSVISVSESKYLELLDKWNVEPMFVDLNRNINKYGRCGVDGDMYKIKWNGKINTSQAHTKIVSFKNPVKISHSAFKYPEMSDKEAELLGLYKYPAFHSEYRQSALLSPFNFDDSVHVKFEHLNGLLGPINKVKTFTLLFVNKPIDIAFKQEQYWEGGNQNELVTCIGVDSNLVIQWVKPFSWCDNKRICIDTIEDIAELHKFDPDSVISIYYKNIPKYFHYKSFADFNYLVFEPTKGQLIFVYIMTLLISIGCCIFIIKNQIEP